MVILDDTNLVFKDDGIAVIFDPGIVAIHLITILIRLR